jgi:Ca2+:H+ antiporter
MKAGPGGGMYAPVETNHAQHYGPNDIMGLLEIFKSNIILTAMLVFVPLGMVAEKNHWSNGAIFTANFLAVVPMAWLIGTMTEELAKHTGETIGGLINATFGNIVEMLLCVAGIRKNQLELTQSTLLGSILSNLLLVMGCAFLAGGYYYKVQTYNSAGAQIQCSMLVLACLALSVPTMYSELMVPNNAPEDMTVLQVSRYSSVILFFMYLCYLVFQLKTHAYLFEDPDAEGEEEEALLTACFASVMLAICTVTTSFCTDYLIASIEGTIQTCHISKEFIGIILLPIIGNAAEHYTAITVAMRNKMDLSLGVAVGSSCQMALLVTPFTVVTGWIVDRDMDLDFHPFQLGVLILSILVTAAILQNGQCTWLEGLMLLAAYFVIALVYFFEPPGMSTYVEVGGGGAAVGAATMAARAPPAPPGGPVGKVKMKMKMKAKAR